MKRKLVLLVIFVVTMATIASGVLLSFFVNNSYTSSLDKTHVNHVEDSIETYEVLHARNSYVNDYHYVQSLSEKKGVRVTLFDERGKVLADSLNNSLIFNDAQSFEEITQSLDKGYGYSSREDELNGQYTRYYVESFQLDLNKKGMIRVGSSLETLTGNLRLIIDYYVIALILSVLLTILAGFFAVRKIVQPITDLTIATSNIADGNYDNRLVNKSNDEIGVLTESFNVMTASVRTAITELNNKNTHLDAVINEMFSGIVAIDRNGEVFLFNTSAEKILGLAFDDVVGKQLDDTKINCDIKDQLIYSIEEDVEVFGEINLQNTKILEVQFASIKDPNENVIIGGLCVFRDISEKRRLETMRQEFVTNISHELRTPLTSISGFVETLKYSDDLGRESIGEIVEILETESSRMQDLINDMLRLSEIENVKVLTDFVPLNLIPLIERSIEMVSGQAKKSGIEIIKEFQGNNFVCDGNEEWFVMLMTNLLVNAIKYNKPNGYVKVIVESANDNVKITVEDSGVGIPESDLENVFLRFYRVDKSRNQSIKGFGLGLSVVKRIVENMDGKVFVSSQLDVGTSFTIILPNVN